MTTVDQVVLTPVTRPNGKVYHPRKAPAVTEVDHPHEDESYVYVLRTHELERAYELASRCHNVDRTSAKCTWVRLAMRDGDPFYEPDSERGFPVVVFALT